MASSEQILQLRLQAEADAAVAELRAAAGEVRNLGKAADRATTGAAGGARAATGEFTKLAASQRKAAAGATSYGRAAQVATAQTRGMAGGMRNLGLQLNQVAQVGGMTGNWMQAVAVQLPDMLLGFGAVGIGAGILAGAMIPLVGSLFDGADGAETLDDALDVLAEVAEGLEEPLKVLEMTAQELGKTYGAAALRVREFALAQSELKQNQAEERLRDQVGVLNDLTDGYEAYIEKNLVAGKETVKFSGDLRLLVREMGLTKDQGLAVAHAFDQLREAQTADEQSDALKGILDMLDDMAIPLSQMPLDLQLAIDEMITLNRATAETDAAMAGLAGTAARVAQAGAEAGIGLEAFGGAGEYVDTRKPRKPRTTRSGGGSRAAVDKSFNDLLGEATGAMSGLELAIAAVNEKVAAGLLSTAEGQQAIDGAIRGAASSIGDLIPKLEQAADKAGPQAADKIEEMRKALKGLAGDLDTTARELSKTFSDSLGQSMSDFQSGASSASDAFESFGNTVLGQINRIIAQRFTARFITPLVDSLLGFLPSFGGAVAGAVAPGLVARPAAFAGGAAIARISAQARGAGTASAFGARVGAATPVIVNVTNSAAGVEASASESTQGNERVIEVLVEKVEAGIAGNARRGVGPLSDVLGHTYGIGRVGR